MEKQKRLVVLVVEDEPLMLMDALDLVTDAGFEAIGAKNADEAIRILENRDDIRVVVHRCQHAGLDGRHQTRSCGAQPLAPD